MDVECHKRGRQWRTTLSVKDFIVPSIGRHDNNYITCVNQDCTRIKMHYVVPWLRHYERNIFLETFDRPFFNRAEQFHGKKQNFIKHRVLFLSNRLTQFEEQYISGWINQQFSPRSIVFLPLSLSFALRSNVCRRYFNQMYQTSKELTYILMLL